jgi:hypothetical protein
MTAGRGGAKTLVLEVEAHDGWERSKRVSGEGGFCFQDFFVGNLELSEL